MARSVRAGLVVLALVAVAGAVAVGIRGCSGSASRSAMGDLPIAAPDRISLLTVELRGNDRLNVYFGLMKESQYVAVEEATLAVSLHVPDSTSAPLARVERRITAADFHREPMDGTKLELNLVLEHGVAPTTSLVADVVLTQRGGSELRAQAKLGAR